MALTVLVIDTASGIWWKTYWEKDTIDYLKSANNQCVIGGNLLTSLCISFLNYLVWNLELHFLRSLQVLLFYCKGCWSTSGIEGAWLIFQAQLLRNLPQHLQTGAQEPSRWLKKAPLSSFFLKFQTLIEIFSVVLVFLPFSLLHPLIGPLEGKENVCQAAILNWNLLT